MAAVAGEQRPLQFLHGRPVFGVHDDRLRRAADTRQVLLLRVTPVDLPDTPFHPAHLDMIHRRYERRREQFLDVVVHVATEGTDYPTGHS